jgi:hypothetical protein
MRGLNCHESSLSNVAFGSTPVIENSEPNFRKGPEAEIQTETLPDVAEIGARCKSPPYQPLPNGPGRGKYPGRPGSSSPQRVEAE